MSERLTGQNSEVHEQHSFDDNDYMDVRHDSSALIRRWIRVRGDR